MTIANLLNFYKTPYSNKLKSIAKPLETYLGIEAFGYSHISPRGAFFQITNQPEISEFYFSNGLYKNNLLIRHPDNYYSGFLLPSSIKDNKMHQDQSRVPKFGINSFLAFYKKEGKNAHLFLFSSQKQNMHSHYINNTQLLKKFSGYFLNEWASLFPKMEAYTIDLANLLGPSFFDMKPSTMYFSKELKSKKSFLKALYPDESYCIDSIELTLKEKECIQYLSQGKTLKETAEKMQISSRTAESYYENAKDKLCCETKSQFLEKIQLLQLLDF